MSKTMPNLNYLEEHAIKVTTTKFRSNMKKYLQLVQNENKVILLKNHKRTIAIVWPVEN